MNRKYVIATAVAAGLSVLLGFPSPAKASLKKDLRITLAEQRIKELSGTGLTLAFHISVVNDSDSAAFLVRYAYRVTVDQKEFLNMTVALDDPLQAPPRQETRISLPVKFTYALLFEAVGPLQEKAVCDVYGEMWFRDERGREDRFPIAFSGEFPIFKEPEVEFLPLRINDLTIGGADLVFGVRFRNPNGYDLLVDRISYRLYFGDKLVLDGLVPGDKTIPPLGGRESTLPFLMDFFEAGAGFHEMLKSGRVPCRFEGEMEIISVWDRLIIRFDKQGELTAAKTS